MCPQASDCQCVLRPLFAISWSDVRLTSSDSLHRLFHADENIVNQHCCGQRFFLKTWGHPRQFRQGHTVPSTHTIVQRWKSLLWPWFYENGVNTLMLGCNRGPVLCQSHYSACIQEPITVRVTHCGGARWKDKPSGWLVGGVGVITWHKRNQLNVIQPSRVIPRCNICYANLSVTTNPFNSIFFVHLQILNILSVFLIQKLII